MRKRTRSSNTTTKFSHSFWFAVVVISLKIVFRDSSGKADTLQLLTQYVVYSPGSFGSVTI